MRIPQRPSLSSLLRPAGVLLGAALAASAAPAVTIQAGPDATVTLGAGLRASVQSLEDGAPSGKGRSEDFELENARLFLSGTYMKIFGATFNTEIRRDAKGNEDGIRVMDAYIQYEPSPNFNLWVGRMLPPSDRANLDGPFFLFAWDYPLVSQYPNLAIGRDNGITAWGKPFGGKLTYAVGAFKGHNRVAGGSNEDGNPLYAGRLAFALLDPEPAPAYYTASTYYGAKDILTVGVAALFQKDGVGTSAAVKDDYFGANVDVLFEKRIGTAGVLTLEAAAYTYDFDVPDAAPASGNVGGLVAGDAQLFGAAWLVPDKVGPGRFQPFVRTQRFKPDNGLTSKSHDIGVNYVINGHNARLSLVYTRLEVGGVDRDKLLLGAQFQF